MILDTFKSLSPSSSSPKELQNREADLSLPFLKSDLPWWLELELVESPDFTTESEPQVLHNKAESSEERNCSITSWSKDQPQPTPSEQSPYSTQLSAFCCLGLEAKTTKSTQSLPVELPDFFTNRQLDSRSARLVEVSDLPFLRCMFFTTSLDRRR